MDWIPRKALTGLRDGPDSVNGPRQTLRAPDSAKGCDVLRAGPNPMADRAETWQAQRRAEKIKSRLNKPIRARHSRDGVGREYEAVLRERKLNL